MSLTVVNTTQLQHAWPSALDPGPLISSRQRTHNPKKHRRDPWPIEGLLSQRRPVGWPLLPQSSSAAKNCFFSASFLSWQCCWNQLSVPQPATTQLHKQLKNSAPFAVLLKGGSRQLKMLQSLPGICSKYLRWSSSTSFLLFGGGSAVLGFSTFLGCKLTSTRKLIGD